MPLNWVRIDDRLLHGQVTMGWRDAIDAEVWIVADDRAAADPWEREVYEASGPDAAEVRVMSAADAGVWATSEEARRRVCALLVRGPLELEAVLGGDGLRAGSGDIGPVNVGGLHAGPRRRRVRDDLHLSDRERAAFDRLRAGGLRFIYQPLPSDPALPLDVVLAGPEREREARDR